MIVAPEAAPCGELREPRGVVAGAGLVSYKTSVTGGGWDGFGAACADSFELGISAEDYFERRFRRMRRSVWWAGQGHAERFSGLFGERAHFVTLTYRPGCEWGPRHMADALRRCRAWAKRRGVKRLRYVWVAEMQKRGAVHYHVIVYLPKRLAMPKWDKQGWWPHGMTNVQVARAGVGYLMKYVSKFSIFHKFPKGARIYGIGGLNSEARAIRTWHNLPEWAKQRYGVGELVRKACGLVVRESGEVLASPWVVVRGGGRLFLRLVGELVQGRASGPYSSLVVAG